MKASAIRVFMLIALGLAIGAGSTEGQTMSFLRQLSTWGPVAADGSGIYVFGSTVRKYDSSGGETMKFGFVGLSILACGAVWAQPL